MADADPLESLIAIGVKIVEELLPNWDVDLKHPYAKVYMSRDMLLTGIKAGDQIMVKTKAGYWHHGIYIGAERKEHMVVDAWGLDKERSTISVRTYSDFVCGAVGFAKAKYPSGTAVDRHASKEQALQSVKWAEENNFVYDAFENNCEHFATMCRCKWYVYTTYDALESHLALVPDLPIQSPHKREFLAYNNMFPTPQAQIAPSPCNIQVS